MFASRLPLRPRPAADRGFTLIEVLVALVIAGSALVALSQGVRASLTLSQQATQLDQAVTRARSHLVAAERDRLVAGDRSGDDGGGYRWKTTVRPDATATPSLFGSAGGRPPRLTLFTVTSTVSWKAGRADKEVSLATKAIGPAESDRR